MKKIYVPILLILFFPLLFLSQSFWGLNITLAELLGGQLPFLRANPAKIKDQKNALILQPYVQGLNTPRFMHLTESGDLLVTEPHKGRVILIPYQKPSEKRTLISGLKKPHSMDIYDNYLYIAEENAIGRIRFNALKKTTEGSYTRIIKNIPDDGGHWTRTIKFGPDGYAYVSIGSSCNSCVEKNPLRATISRFKPGETQLTIYATGLRNSVGFDWSPVDGKLYATENSRDFLGDHFPPDELNLIENNQFYGWPYVNGNQVLDPKLGKGKKAILKKSKPPVFEFPAHQAALGLTFIKNLQSPLYKKALVAFHGSWNSSVKVGYKVTSLNFDKGNIIQEDFITGFLEGGKVLGRPVHIIEGKQGELYLSDDFNGIIYRILLR